MIMRYVNLKKRNTSKFDYVAKRLATISMLSLFLVSVIIIPLANKQQELQAENHLRISDITDENLDKDVVEFNN